VITLRQRETDNINLMITINSFYINTLQLGPLKSDLSENINRDHIKRLPMV